MKDNNYRQEKITIVKDCLELTNYINHQNYQNHSTAIAIIDQNLKILYADFFDKLKITKIFISSGEASKSLNSISIILEQLIAHNINKSSIIIGIGGGSITDLVGFIASILYRGISHIFIPTTLLSMIDSSIGGKTSLNFNSVKNILGTIYPAKEIIINLEFLASLPQNEVNAGLVEIIKIALLSDIEIWNKIYTQDYDLESIISRAIELKQNIVSCDLFDQDQRLMLNYGHTIGHAIEAASKYKINHGYAVALGMLIENEIASSFFNSFNPNSYLLKIFNQMKIPIFLKEINLKISDLLPFMKFDKKLYNNIITMTALTAFGQAKLLKIDYADFIKILEKLDY